MSAPGPGEGKSTATNRIVEPAFRKKKLVKRSAGVSKTKYYVWIAGHIACLVFGTVTLLWQILWLPNRYYINSIAYRLCLLGSTAAFTATLSKKFGLHFLPPFTTLVAQHNFQYLVLTVIWCFTFKSVFKVFPLYLISFLQLADHKKIGAVQKHADTLGSVLGFNELILIAYLFLRTLFFRSTSGYQLAIMMIFLWLRILFDRDTAQLITYVVEKADTRISGVKNEKVQMVWGKIKRFLEAKRSDTYL